jgi:hypothetical protein
VRSGPCRDVAAPSGSWRSTALFADAPDAPGTPRACVYAWTGADGPSADVDALRGALGPNAVLTPACDDEPLSGAGTALPIEHLGLPVFSGSTGCDVCGVVKKNKMWIVLPPGLVQAKEFVVDLTNGDQRAFELHVAEGVRATSVVLPPPPAGTKYVEGPVTIF